MSHLPLSFGPFITDTCVVNGIKFVQYISVLHLVVTKLSTFLEFGILFPIVSGIIDLGYAGHWFSDMLTHWHVQFKEHLSDIENQLVSLYIKPLPVHFLTTVMILAMSN